MGHGLALESSQLEISAPGSAAETQAIGKTKEHYLAHVDELISITIPPLLGKKSGGGGGEGCAKPSKDSDATCTVSNPEIFL